MAEAPSEHPGDDLDDTVRRADPDRWLASRFIADVEARADVIALYAFEHVLARVPAMVSEPLMGEIRLTWWSEALDEIYAGGVVRSHPVSLALARAVRRRGLDRAPLDEMIAARFGDLDAAPFANEAEVLAYADQTAGALMQASTKALGGPAGFEPARVAGRAYGLSQMARRRAIGCRTRLPDSVAADRLRKLIADALRDARAPLKTAPLAAFPATAYACLARCGQSRRIATLETQLRLVWTTATGSL
jgi:phytoene synthase